MALERIYVTLAAGRLPWSLKRVWIKCTQCLGRPGSTSSSSVWLCPEHAEEAVEWLRRNGTD